MRRWMMMWMTALVLTTGVNAVGCATTPGRAAADVLVPVSDEVAMGRQMAQELEQELTLHPDPEVQAYVQKLGMEVVRAVPNRPKGLAFQFKVVDDPSQINAFAIPGGGIYVYSGLLRAMSNEAELVSVLSHEVAHVTRRHIAQRLVTAYGLDAIAQLALGQNPGLLSQLVGTVLAQGFMLKYSRDHERDADEWGLRYMVRADYNPQGFVSFFETLAGQGGARAPEFLLTHPHPESRIEGLQALIDEIPDKPTRTGQESFEAMKPRF
ncbi:hypothetical protein DL240_01855 [Lujinxingia litoralis]|uniref:Peptidase M48 domain-containing protein n=1 Tax=Lujinxingia litoralis TaxID=2211119 RepID=A0A328CDF6_9DELT|nr:M48 family metallopeptidase [Lujinxingia litoralis]RAL24979.1 hypothetical protein DL240_01855 [Lujinxingia litoralis]